MQRWIVEEGKGYGTAGFAYIGNKLLKQGSSTYLSDEGEFFSNCTAGKLSNQPWYR
jgi:hypothetical protein